MEVMLTNVNLLHMFLRSKIDRNRQFFLRLYVSYASYLHSKLLHIIEIQCIKSFLFVL